MQLRVSILNKTYTLNSNREYVLGCGEDCDIPLGLADAGSTEYLKLIYNAVESAWYAYESNVNSFMTVDGQRKTICPIEKEVKICISNQFFLTVVPLGEIGASKPTSLTSGTQIPQYPVEKFGNTIPIIDLGWKWFKISSPSDGVGIRLSDFDLYQTYVVKRDRLNDLCEMLYQRVFKSVSDGTLQEARVRLLQYSKSTFTQSDTRKYLLITRDTIQGNRTTVFLRFLEFGNNLYVGLDVYSLGRINWFTFLVRIVATNLLLSLFFIPSPISIIPFLLIIILWWKIVWRMNYEKKPWLALRQEHPGKIGLGPFDSDDVIMFSKSTVHLAVTTVRDVFGEVGLPVDSLDEFIVSINNLSIDNSTKVDNRGGTIMHSAIGIGNQSTA
jgi:hypothetical protein